MHLAKHHPHTIANYNGLIPNYQLVFKSMASSQLEPSIHQMQQEKDYGSRYKPCSPENCQRNAPHYIRFLPASLATDFGVRPPWNRQLLIQWNRQKNTDETVDIYVDIFCNLVADDYSYCVYSSSHRVTFSLSCLVIVLSDRGVHCLWYFAQCLTVYITCCK